MGSSIPLIGENKHLKVYAKGNFKINTHIMSIRDGYQMCYFGSTEYNRINNQACVRYISPSGGKEYNNTQLSTRK